MYTKVFKKANKIQAKKSSYTKVFKIQAKKSSYVD